MRSILFALVILSSLLSVTQSQSNTHYATTDPAISEMLTSMDTSKNAGKAPTASIEADPAIRDMLISMDMPRYAGSASAEIVAGDWHLSLANGKNITFALVQSGSAVFGKGTMDSKSVSLEAFASGSVYGSKLNLDVVPENGTELYAVSIDINSHPYEGKYVAFLGNYEAQCGMLTADKNATEG